MILAVFTKNKPTDRWSLYSVAKSIEAAKKHQKTAIKEAKEIGYTDFDATIQKFASVYDVPKLLDIAQPEKLLYN